MAAAVPQWPGRLLDESTEADDNLGPAPDAYECPRQATPQRLRRDAVSAPPGADGDQGEYQAGQSVSHQAAEAQILTMVREVFSAETAAWLNAEFRLSEGDVVRKEVVVLPSGFPEPFFSDLRSDATANIIQLIAETVPTLTQAGTTWKGLCPFHQEKTPSFHVNPDKGFFHCFGCGAGGDAFKFIQNRDHIGFREAVQFLAERFAMEVPTGECG